ncbi:hypothetical protein QWY28_03325 [Nocardioides sp. SOB77]|uniref:Uncharacterized protein n=1 Tax=Nocardioides oceani TaxID=3058369 RepID=A0ABT8FB96_9ACTN|nr:hypothetical protein [Nocardioides oceani]MDN4171967.1 hypothetical protein [Nocardioides oceani]
MSGNDRDQDAPSLEPPTLFGRKRRKKDAAPAPVRSDEATRVDTPALPVDETPTTVVPPVAEPAPTPPPAPASEPTRAPEPAPEPVREPAPATEVVPVPPPTPARQAPPRPERTPEPAALPFFADEAPVMVEHDAPAEPTRLSEQAEPAEPREPFVTGMPAACLTGLVVGLATVALTWLGLRGCEAAKGTSSCGDPGFFLLLAILVAMVLLGSALLRFFRVSDPGSTSFLAVGLLTVLVLLFLIEALFSWTMLIVIPVLAIGCFALSHWVTTTFVDTAD